MQKQKVLKTLIYSGAAVSAVLFLVLFYCVRSEPDDMTVAMPFRGANIFEILKTRYFHESFRPVYPIVSFFAFGYSVNDNLYHYSVFVVYLAIWVSTLFVFFRLLQELFPNGKYAENKLLLFCFSQWIFTALYFLTTARIEVYGFISVAIIHYLPVLFTLLSALFIIKKSKKKSDYLWLTVSAFFVAGGADHIGAVVLGILFVTGCVFLAEKNIKKVFSDNKKMFGRVFFFAGVLFLFFVICATNPGILLHYNDSQQIAHNDPAVYHMKTGATLKMYFVPWKIFGFFLLATILPLFFKTCEVQFPGAIKLKYFLGAALIAVLITGVTGWLAYNSMMVSRVWFVADAAIFIFLCAVIVKFRKENSSVYTTGLSFAIVIMILFNIRHIPKLFHYATSFDKTLVYLKSLPADTVVTIPAFPDSDLSSQAYYSDDPDYEINTQFCDFYNIKARFSVKKPPTEK